MQYINLYYTSITIHFLFSSLFYHVMLVTFTSFIINELILQYFSENL